MKLIARHETEEAFFVRMTSLAKKLDRHEPVESYEGLSFEDEGEMNAFRSEYEKEALKASFTLIFGNTESYNRSTETRRSLIKLRGIRSARWSDATVTFEREAKKIVENYTTTTLRLIDGSFVITKVIANNSKRRT